MNIDFITKTYLLRRDCAFEGKWGVLYWKIQPRKEIERENVIKLRYNLKKVYKEYIAIKMAKLNNTKTTITFFSNLNYIDGAFSGWNTILW